MHDYDAFTAIKATKMQHRCFLSRHAHKNIDRRLFYDVLAVPDEEGSAAVVVAGVAAPVAIGSEAAVVAACLSLTLTIFLVRFVTVLFALAVFFAKGFDFLDTLPLPFFFATLLALRTILAVISFPSSYSVRK